MTLVIAVVPPAHSDQYRSSVSFPLSRFSLWVCVLALHAAGLWADDLSCEWEWEIVFFIVCRYTTAVTISGWPMTAVC